MAKNQGDAQVTASGERVVIWTLESIDGRLESDGTWAAVFYLPRPDLHQSVLHVEDSEIRFGRAIRKAFECSVYGRSYEDHGFSEEYPHWKAQDELDPALAHALGVRPSSLKRSIKRSVGAFHLNGVVTFDPYKKRRGQFESHIGDPEVTVAYAASDEEIGRALKTALSMSG